MYLNADTDSYYHHLHQIQISHKIRYVKDIQHRRMHATFYYIFQVVAVYILHKINI